MATTPQLSLPQLDSARLSFITSVAPATLTPALEHLRDAAGSADASGSSSSLAEPDIARLHLAAEIAELSEENAEITGGLLANPEILSLRDVANNYDNKKLGALLGTEKSAGENSLQLSTAADTSPTEIPPAVLAFQRKVFHKEPSGVVARMVRDGEIPIGSIKSQNAAISSIAGLSTTDNPVKDGVVAFFQTNPDFNIRNTSVLEIIADPQCLEDVPDHVRSDVVKSIKLLQTTQSLSHTPDALPGLVKAGMTSAHVVTQLSEAHFISKFASELGGEDVAKAVHTHATNVVIRNDLALTSLLQKVRGSGVAMIDGRQSRSARMQEAVELAGKQRKHLDLETLFGPLDICACDDCNSVTSPAAYFVEILQYLRNNNLDFENQASGQDGYEGTALEVLLRRRPDLADLELTCANTTTVLPYIDLANEVMESFIVNLPKFAGSSPHQATLDVYNADPNEEGAGGSSPELLAQPQNTNDKAYCILKEAVYPSTKLPFHQPVEAIRLYLDFLHTNRAELGLVFRRPYTAPTTILPEPSSSESCEEEEEEESSSSCSSSDSRSSSDSDGTDDDSSHESTPPSTGGAVVPISPEGQAKLRELHELALSRADDAERLLLTEEEYIILTKEAFWVKEYFDIRYGTATDRNEYRRRIGVKPDFQYWGVDYVSVADMLSQDESKQSGLSFVKSQFLPRTGLAYSELVDLIKTDFINPNVPIGRDKVIFQSFRTTYRYMQTLLKTAIPGGPRVHKYERFKPLVDFLVDEKWRAYLAENKQPDVASLFEDDKHKQKCHHLDPDCGCCKPAPKCRHHHPGLCQCHLRHRLFKWLCRNFEKLGKIVVLESVLQELRHPTTPQDATVGTTTGASGLIPAKLEPAIPEEAKKEGQLPFWTDRMGALLDTCDIRKDRLRHLDGTSLCAEEYDRLHRFVRLWRKLGWTMIELDVAIHVLTPHPPAQPPTTPDQPAQPTPAPSKENSDDVEWDDFVDNCQNGDCGKKECNTCKGDKTDHEEAQRGRKKRHRHRHHRHHRSCSTSTCDPDDKTPKKFSTDIAPELLHELVELKRLNTLTGLPLLNLIAFWGPISTSGTPSLYSQLFLTHNLLGIDQVFKADENENYLAASPPTKMSDHVHILLAAFGLRVPGLAALLKALWPDKAPDLTIDTVSLVYRYVLLGKILQVKPETLSAVFDILSIKPFASASEAVKLIELWNKMSDAGFTFPQLQYVFMAPGDSHQTPVGPSDRAILQATMTLYTGLNDINVQHPDIKGEDAATSAVVLANVQLLYSPEIATQIVGFLDGTMTFQTKAPSGLLITVPQTESALVAKLKYADGVEATLQITGQLTADETAKAKTLSASPQWVAAIDRLARRAGTFFKGTLLAVFPENAQAKAKETLLTGDIIPAPSDPNAAALATGPKKRAFFLSFFIPYLRRRLADKLVVDTMASATSLDPLITNDLLTYVLKVSKDGGTTSVSALQTLENIKDDPPTGSVFKGYLIPDTTDAYTLVAISEEAPADIFLDSIAIPLQDHSPDDEPPDMWASKPIRLTGGRLYAIELRGLQPAALQWKTDRTQLSPIPASSLLGNHVTAAIRQVFSSLYKCAIVINGLSLVVDEVNYFQKHGSDFRDPKQDKYFDWNKLSLPLWHRLVDYSSLKRSLPKLGLPLINLFAWMNGPDSASADAKVLAGQIARYTLWSEDDVALLIDSNHYNIAAALNFRNEINFAKLKRALDARNQIGVDIDLLFTWAQPRIDFWKLRDIRDSIRVAIRAQFKLSDWEVAIKPTHDKLRQLQSDALTAYLINQPALKNQTVVEMVDADSLFEFLLIDNQMCPCMETARMKQATSSVQLFVQRCMLGLEPDVGPDKLDRDRWDWMQRYRVWEANRKIYLYPENWIQPSLRDDKSPVYLQLESELHQRDLDTAAVTDIMKEFLFRLDEVSNLEANAIYVEDVVDKQGKKVNGRIHIFARTRAAPYKFYYRIYDWRMKNWGPWQDVAVDIPRYDVEKPPKTTAPGGGPDTPGPSLAKSSGFYLVPFTFNSRLMLAVPQFQKTQLAAPVPKRKMADLGNNADADESTPEEFWEIKMGLTEMRNGKWTAKQITSESIAERPQSAPPFYPPLPPIGAYKFVARTDETLHQVYIDAYRLEFPATNTNPSADVDTKVVGRFTFTGSHFGVDINGPLDITDESQRLKWSDFQFQGLKAGDPAPNSSKYRVMYPIQGTQTSSFEHEADAYVKYSFDDTDKASSIKYGGNPADEAFYHPFVNDLIDAVSRTDNLNDLFAYFSSGRVTLTDDAYGAPQIKDTSAAPFDELYRPYSLYNWELGFHAPMAIVDRLLQNQQFDLALKMIHYIFDPLASGTDDKRYWKWPPFREINSLESIVDTFKSLQPNKPEPESGPINAWRDNPFRPHLVARLRPVAYMKYVVMKYISILIAYGDYYFNQNTLETVPMAIQCYVLASHIYGKPAQKIPKRGKKKVQTYRTLLNQWDAFSNALVQMEILFPFSINQIPVAGVLLSNKTVSLANIFGFATMQYFCVPDNPELKAVRDLIDDRLFKIRHCQDIKGVERRLPLYEPPIDPSLLVAATASGLSLSSVLNDLNSPLPNFRFTSLLKKAFEMCQHLKDFGAALTVAKERKDSEALLSLKQTHENTVHSLVTNQKKLALQEANKAVDALQQSRKVPEYHMQHNLQQLGEDYSTIPTPGDIESEFKQLADKIETPVVESGIKLIAAEKEELLKVAQSLDLKPIINAIETAASELHILPVLNAHASPFGVGLASCWGPPNIAKGIQGVAKAYQAVSEFLAHQSSKISKVQNFARATQMRIKEANTTGHEIKKIDKQIVTQQVRVAVHEAEIETHDKAVANAQEVQDFLASKYTNTELYTWVDQETSNLYYRAYTAAYDLAKKAEMAFRYERGLPEATGPPPFVRFGYWEPKNSGLLCGERLLLSLKEMEAAYQEARGHDYEITKHVSLRAVNPLQLFRLRGDAVAEFAVPEILFDMDFPGHYGRRLRSVALTIRTRVPTSQYDNVNCTLRLTSHKFRNDGTAKGKADYPEKTDADDRRFSSSSYVPIEAIATSSPERDAGLFAGTFALDFSTVGAGERFLPFEGAGAISSWRLELNESFHSFDYDNIDDVVLSLQYTSLEGGGRLKNAASDTVKDYIASVTELSENEGLFAVFDVPRDFPNEWTAATAGTAPPTGGRAINLVGLNTRLPAYAKGRAPEKIQTRDVWIATDKMLVPGDMSIKQGGTTLGFNRADGKLGSGDGALSALHSSDGPAIMKDWVVVVGEAITDVKEMLILVRYSLKT